VAWNILFHPEAVTELGKVPARERAAIGNVAYKLAAVGPNLGYPHSSSVRTADNLRELRPRQGRSQWRAFYRQFGQAFVIGAIGPEADVNGQGFSRAVRAAEARLDDVEMV
jgi:hypothetical protein